MQDQWNPKDEKAGPIVFFVTGVRTRDHAIRAPATLNSSRLGSPYLQSFIPVTVGLAVKNSGINVKLTHQGLITRDLYSMALLARLRRASLDSRITFGNRLGLFRHHSTL